MKNKEKYFKKFYEWIIENFLWEALALIFSLISSGSIKILPWDFLNLKNGVNGIIVFLIYFFLFFGVFRFLFDIFHLLFKPDRFIELAEARTEGVKLRNKGLIVKNEEEAVHFIDDYDEWDRTTIKKIAKISKSKAEYFKVINRFEFTTGQVFTKIKTHNKKLNVLEEKLRRLEFLISELEKHK